MKLKKIISIIMVILLLLPAIPVYAASQENIMGIVFSWSDNDSEFITPFEEGKTLSYYTNKMQSIPAQDGMNFVGWKLHGSSDLLNDSTVITAAMCDSETPEIIWIEAVFEEEQSIMGIVFSWSDNDSEFITPFEEGKTLSYYTNKMQSVPAQDGMNFVGWKLHGSSDLLNDSTVITAAMCDSETPEIIWIEAVFEEEQSIMGIVFSWSDNDSEFITPFEEGKTLSYYTNKMQSVPAQDGMNFVGWKLHGSSDLLNDSTVITAAMCDSETPEIIWIEAVFEEEQSNNGIVFIWGDNGSETIVFEAGKTLSYYTSQMQNVPSQEGMKFVGWKLDGSSVLLNDDDVINAGDKIVAVFEANIPEPTPSDKEDNMDWYWMMLMMLQNTKYDVTATAGEGGSITNAGTSKVKYGNSITYFINPDEGYEIESVKVNGKEMGAITEYTFKNVRSKQNISATFKKVVEPEWVNPFTDISKSDDYYAAIEFVYENNLFKGTSDTTFAPNTTMSRGMFVTVLGRLAKVDVSAYTNVAFDDVIADQYYAPYVAWAVEKGITLGYGDGTFGVDDEVTIEQAIVFIARFAKLCDVETDFSDIDFTAYADVNDVSEWAFIEMLWALENGIYDVDEAILNPQGKAARWLVAEMIYNFCGNYEIIE